MRARRLLRCMSSRHSAGQAAPAEAHIAKVLPKPLPPTGPITSNPHPLVAAWTDRFSLGFDRNRPVEPARVLQVPEVGAVEHGAAALGRAISERVRVKYVLRPADFGCRGVLSPSREDLADPLAETNWISANYWSEWQDLNLRPPRPE